MNAMIKPKKYSTKAINLSSTQQNYITIILVVSSSAQYYCSTALKILLDLGKT